MAPNVSGDGGWPLCPVSNPCNLATALQVPNFGLVLNLLPGVYASAAYCNLNFTFRLSEPAQNPWNFTLRASSVVPADWPWAGQPVVWQTGMCAGPVITVPAVTYEPALLGIAVVGITFDATDSVDGGFLFNFKGGLSGGGITIDQYVLYCVLPVRNARAPRARAPRLLILR